MEFLNMDLRSGESQSQAVWQDGVYLGRVLRYALSRNWYWESANGGRGEVRTKNEAAQTLLEMSRRNR